jgi:hypothetical protein
MYIYYVTRNAQPNGDHEVHQHTCAHLPRPAERLYLGQFATCSPAILEARRTYPRSNGCHHCAPDCHSA